MKRPVAPCAHGAEGGRGRGQNPEHFALLPHYPVWATLPIACDVPVIWGLEHDDAERAPIVGPHRGSPHAGEAAAVSAIDDAAVTWVLVSVLGFVAEAYLIVALGRRITGAYDPWADEAGSASGANDPWDKGSGTRGTGDDEPRAASRSF